MKEYLKDSTIDEFEHDQDMNSHTGFSIGQSTKEKITLVNNITKPVLRLEKLYDLQDKFKKFTNYKTHSIYTV
jgi:hypothetical protein